jgi:hypothetical protein
VRLRADFELMDGHGSDAPLVSQVVVDQAGETGLLRRIDPAFRPVPAAREAFLAEIQAGSAIPQGHDSLMPLLACDTGPDPFLIRSFSAQGSLSERLATGRPLSSEQCLHAVAFLATALDDLEGLGLRHGDPWPYNLIVTQNGELRLSDPRSSRRLIAAGPGGVSPQQESATDRDAPVRILAYLLGRKRLHREDDLRPELQRILLCNDAMARKREALQRLATEWPVPSFLASAQASSAAELEELVEPEEEPILAEASSVWVTVNVGAVNDAIARDVIARIGAPFARGYLHDLPEALKRGGVQLDMEFPDPCLDVTAEIRRAGAGLSVSYRATN